MRLQRIATALIAIAVTISTILVFTCPYLDYGAESVSLGVFQRISSGLSGVSDNYLDLPIQFSPYSPYFYFLLTPIAKLFSPQDPWNMAFALRSLILASIFCIFAVILQTLKITTKDTSPKLIFPLVFFVTLLIDPGLFLSIRPDLISTIFECLAVLAIAYKYKAPNDSAKTSEEPASLAIFFAGIFLGVATSFKTNNVGVFLGAAFGLLIINERKKMFHLTMAFGYTLAVSLLTLKPLVGQESLTLIYKTMNNDFAHTQEEWKSLLSKVGLQMIKLLPLILFSLDGLKVLHRSNPRFSVIFGSILAFSLSAAIAGQIKVGSALNYYFSPMLLASIPASITVKGILDQTIKFPKRIPFYTFITLAMIIARVIKV